MSHARAIYLRLAGFRRPCGDAVRVWRNCHAADVRGLWRISRECAIRDVGEHNIQRAENCGSVESTTAPQQTSKGT